MIEKEIDVAEIISNGAIGMSTVNWTTFASSELPNPSDNQYEPMFYFKVDDGEAKLIGDRPIIETRLIGFPAGSVFSVFMVVVMFKFPTIDFIHEVFINHFTDDSMGSMLKKLVNLDELTLLFFEPKSRLLDYKPVRVLHTKNTMPWHKFLGHIEEHYLEPWSMEHFTEAKFQCPSTKTMWEVAKC